MPWGFHANEYRGCGLAWLLPASRAANHTLLDVNLLKANLLATSATRMILLPFAVCHRFERC